MTSQKDSGCRSAFVITSHAGVAQIARLVDTLLAGGPGIRVYISHDIAGEPGIEELEGERCQVIREKGGRGDFTQIERIVSLFRMVEQDGGADYVTVLSGMDYPVRPIAEFVEALDASGDGMLHHFPALDPHGSDWHMHEARQRYLYKWRIFWPMSNKARDRWHWLHAINYVQPLIRVNVSYGSFRVGVYRGRLPHGITCWGGSAWFTLSRRAVRYVLDSEATRPEIAEWGRTSLATDEVYFQSILLSAGHFQFENHNGRYIDFDGDGFGHPKVLTEEDYDRIMESGAFFIRKVDRELSASLLDLLDRNVHGAAGGHRV